MGRRIQNGKSLFLIWLLWTISSGAINLLVILSLYLPAKWLPVAAYVLQFGLFILIRRNRESSYPNCYLIPFITSRILFWTGTVMLALNLMMRYGVIHQIFPSGEINPDIPFITVLIIGPVSMIISWWAMRAKFTLSFCKVCVRRCGTPAERGFLGTIYTQESRHLQLLLFYSCFATAIIGWVYYFFYYANDTLTAPDRLVYFGIPLMVWIATVVYVGIRCIGLWEYFRQKLQSTRLGTNRTTMLRYILIHGNRICLRSPELDPDSIMNCDLKWDTPVSSHLSYQPHIDISQSIMIFGSLTHLSNVDLRFMYTTSFGNADVEIHHYLCFLTDEQKEAFDKSNPDCEWVHMQKIANLMNSHRLNTLMSAEIMRLHTIAMAWKTYTETGKRRYKIKNYKPTFKVSDIKKWDVDYNNPVWLYVAQNNEDTAFYKLRRFWRRYITGMEEYKTKSK